MSVFILIMPIGLFQFQILSENIGNLSQKDYIDLIHTSQSTNEKMFDWNKTYGGANFEQGHAIAVNSTGYVFVTGYTRTDSLGEEDAFLLCIDSMGNQKWLKRWGTTEADYGTDIAVDSVGNIYICGYTKGMGAGLYDMFLTKYNALGNNLINFTWGLTKNDKALALAIDSSNNIIVSGSSDRIGTQKIDAVVLKVNSSLNIQWEQTYGGLKNEYGYGVCIDSNNDVYMAGSTNSYGQGGTDLIVLKYSSGGAFVWNATWGGIFSEEGYALAVDSLDNIYVTGYTSSIGSGLNDVCLIKYNKGGTFLWNKTWGDDGSEDGKGIDIDSSGNIFVSGATNSFGAGDMDFCLLKYNVLGEQIWEKTWGEELKDEGFDITVEVNETIYAIGYTENYGAGAEDICLVRYSVDTDGDGLSDWQETNLYSTDPSKVDSDGDGYSDKDEILSGHDPNNALSSPMIDLIVWIVIIAIGAAVVVVIVILVRRGAEGRAERRAQRTRDRERAAEAITDRQRADQAREERERIKRERGERERIEKEQLDQEKREKEQQLQNVIELIDKLIQEYDFASAISGLNDIIEMAEAYDLTRVIKWAKKNKKYCETFESVLNLLRISRRSKIDDLASIMEVERTELLRRLIKSAQEVQFVIDGEYIELDPEYFGSFVKMLEGHYKELLDQEKILEKGPELEEQKVACIVCKGEIMAVAYNCPNCTAVYHLNCAHSLKDADDKCWQCGTPFPALPRPVEDEGIITKEEEKPEKKKEKKKKKKKKKKE